MHLLGERSNCGCKERAVVRTTENTGKRVVLNDKCNWPKLLREILKEVRKRRVKGKPQTIAMLSLSGN